MTALKIFSIPLIFMGCFLMLYSLFSSKEKIDSFSFFGSSLISAILGLLFQKSPILGKRIITFIIFLFGTIIGILMFIEN